MGSMKKRVLMDSQKIEIQKTLLDHGLPPSLFRWLETPSDLDPDIIVSRLVCLQNHFFFSFEIKNEFHFSIFSPAPKSHIGTDFPETWDAQLLCFSRWLDLIVTANSVKDLQYSVSPPDIAPNSNQKTPDATSSPPEPAGSPGFSSRLEHILEMVHQSAENRPQSSHPPGCIKRYYGKA